MGVQRRLREAGLPGVLSPYSFRVTTITDLLEQGVPREDVQRLAGHAGPHHKALRPARQEDPPQHRRAHLEDRVFAARAVDLEQMDPGKLVLFHDLRQRDSGDFLQWQSAMLAVNGSFCQRELLCLR